MQKRCYLLVVFLSGISVGMIGWSIFSLALPSPAYAQERGESSGVGAGNLIAVTGLCSNSYSGLWVIDASSGEKTPSVCLYIPENGGRGLRLAASRRIKWDLMLPQYNDKTEPRMSPGKMKQEVDRLEQKEREEK